MRPNGWPVSAVRKGDNVQSSTIFLKLEIYLLLKCKHGIYRLVRAALECWQRQEALADRAHGPVL